MVAFRKIIRLEFDILEWNAKSSNYKNKKFNDNDEFRVAWKDLCFAGRDAEIDIRTGVAECRDPDSYQSAVILFLDSFMDSLKNPT
jgi:hypothetical protein